ncbi:type II secretion system F family protein [Candidatus Nanohalococcus occultus]|uniref:Archaeal flagellar protein FlaJ n=1 Tax=Candidatus Nanohalococcus occultus TaxID=2978047 RepID=A0ABY8CHG4_9ARCH|nr:Archaeal flagellar protein FlaJ [Candidatus Nanohaloarchaeota archaeon SVXNc]
MDRETGYSLKLRNFWREQRDLVTMIAAAAVLGSLIAGFNILNHQNAIHKYSLDEDRRISGDNATSFSFELDNPQLAAETTIDLVFSRGVGSSNPLVVSVNGQEASTIQGETTTVSLDSGILAESNNVTIKRRNFAFSDVTLTDASVTSLTNMQRLAFVALNFSAILLIFTPIGYVKYRQYQRRQRMEQEFPEFLREIVEGTRAGMSLPQAIQNTESEGYNGLEEHIEKMNNQMEWGVPFDKVLSQFGEKTGSPVVRRSVDTIIQAYSSGGNIQDVLESVGDNIRSVKKLKEERQSQLYGEMMTGYIVYFIFIGILIALTNYLLPNLAQASGSFGGSVSLFGSGGSGGSLQENISSYKNWFSTLVYLQSVFSGLIIGKLAEGELRAGLKHTAILFAVGYLSVTFFL